MRAELSEPELARRLKQASLLRRLCLSLGRASDAGISGTVYDKEVNSREKGIPAPKPIKESYHRSQ
jgi:hypothetical protein